MTNTKKATKTKLEADYRPSDKEEYMNSQQLEYFKQKLLDWKEQLKEAARHTIETLQDDHEKEPDESDRATEEVEITYELRTRDRYRKLIHKIDMALDRIEKENYGYCEETGEPIGLARLEARPIATLTVEAQERHEKFEKEHNDL